MVMSRNTIIEQKVSAPPPKADMPLTHALQRARQIENLAALGGQCQLPRARGGLELGDCQSARLAKLTSSDLWRSRSASSNSSSASRMTGITVFSEVRVQRYALSV